jgi:uncharacterized iron-regulated protein
LRDIVFTLGFEGESPAIMHRRRSFVTLSLCLFAACASTPNRPEPAGAPSPEAYSAAFTAAAGSRFVATHDRAALVATLRTRRVLWLGDVHGSSRLHALQSELLAHLRAEGVPMVLVLEAIGTQDEAVLQDYLAGRSTFDDLRQTMRKRWAGSWLDDLQLDVWFYRSLVTAAGKTGTPIVPLEPTPRAPLAERDAAIPAAVARVAATHPDRLVVVVVGQAHLLGGGDAIRRTDLPALAIGGEPTPSLRAAGPIDRRRGVFAESDAGLWWFAELCRPAD